VNGVPLRVPVMSPPVAVYVRVEALAAIGVARMQAAMAMTKRSFRRGRFIQKYPLKKRTRENIGSISKPS
jgi:hypothetical protein